MTREEAEKILSVVMDAIQKEVGQGDHYGGYSAKCPYCDQHIDHVKDAFDKIGVTSFSRDAEEAMQSFRRHMQETVIPEICRSIQERVEEAERNRYKTFCENNKDTDWEARAIRAEDENSRWKQYATKAEDFKADIRGAAIRLYFCQCSDCVENAVVVMKRVVKEHLPE